MLIVLVNALSVLIGASLGLLLSKAISKDFKNVVMTSAGVVTLILGIQMIDSEASILAILFSLILGGFIGFALKIDDRVSKIGSSSAAAGEYTIGRGFINASILFCSGAMSIVGSIDIGTTGNGDLILIKSVMDGFMAIVLASTYGKGVLLSSVVILVYQGLIVLASSFLQNVLGSSGIASIASCGGMLLIMIALTLLELKDIKTANFVPALIIAPIFTSILGRMGV